MSTPEYQTSAGLEPDRRSGMDRRATEGRPAATSEHVDRFRQTAATILAFCGGLAILYLFVVAIGAVDLGDAVTATIIAVVLAVLWLAGAFQRYRTGAKYVTRRERERRGF